MIRRLHRLNQLAALVPVACLLATANADLSILEAGEGIEFADMGMDPATGAITLVGTEVFYVSEDRTSFSSAVLVGLGPDTQVFGIAADGSRVAGVSKSHGSEDAGEGTTWSTTASGSRPPLHDSVPPQFPPHQGQADSPARLSVQCRQVRTKLK